MASVRQFLSSQWPAGASALLHGGVLTLLLWHMNAPPIVVPEGAPAAMTVDLVVAETPAVIPAAAPPVDEASASTENTAAEPPPTAPVDIAEVPPAASEEPQQAIADSPPPIESLADVVVAPSPSPAESKPAPKPVTSPRAVPPSKPPAPPQAAALAPPENKPALMLPRPGTMIVPESSFTSPIMPPVPVGPPVDYVGLVRRQLERFKEYPRAAQQRRLQGEVMLSILIDSSGRVLNFRLIKGSGHEILDREVLDLVKRASPMPPIPARLKIDRLEIVVPIEFLLQG